MADSTITSSSDYGYTIGALSNFPESLDSESNLFTAIDSGLTNLSAPVSFDSTIIPVKDATSFPSSGLITVDREVIHYASRTDKAFSNIRRGFSGVRSPHEFGAIVKAAVCADHHNALRDAVWNIQRMIGLSDDESTGTTLYARLKSLEEKFLPVKAIFAAVNTVAPSGSVFTFKDLSRGTIVSRFWEFGDGTTSSAENPSHRYTGEEGSTFTVSLTAVDKDGKVSTVRKSDYITLRSSGTFLYLEPTLYHLGSDGTVDVTIHDQSPGLIVRRSWTFGDGEVYSSSYTSETSVTHTYRSAGTFEITLATESSSGSVSSLPSTQVVTILES